MNLTSLLSRSMPTKAIAIIDDEADLVNLFRKALQMDGFQVCAFTDPIEAFNKLQNRLKEYALIISDYKMPSMNGNELCLKLLNLNPELKVILVSAYDDVQCDISKFLFLRKPIPIPSLLKIVNENLANKLERTKG
jgi:DNA-binding NtrC family response regulator